jgi:mRNA interferase MazF
VRPIIRRGDIVLVDYEPARANEANKIRPSIIITNNLANANGSNVVVIPLTSNTATVYPFQLYLPSERTGLDQDSKAQVELLRSVSVSRLTERIGGVADDLLSELDERIMLHLGLAA